MNDDFENQLRRALRPVEAPEGFAERLMKRLPERERPVVVALPVKPRPEPGRQRLPAALAASLMLAVVVGQQVAHRMEQNQEARELAEGLAAKQELMQALRVTSKKLDMAYQAVNSPPQAVYEENPS
jgi:hypothetical protein